MPIYMTAHYNVYPETVDKCKKTIEEFVQYIRANEPTTIFYMAMQDKMDPTGFIHNMVFENEAAIVIHQNSPATKKFVETVYPSAVKPLEFREHKILGFKCDDAEKLGLDSTGD